jgi:DNA invertase Pin-like site-specific DNA recombinase
MSKRAAIYCRAATRNPAEQSQQFQAQEDRCVHFAQLHGWEIARHFYECAPASTASRPQLGQLFAEVEAGDLEVVVVSDLACLARDLTVYLAIHERLTALGAQLAIVDYPHRERVEAMLASLTDSALAP